MADNVIINGIATATDEVNGQHYQRIKINHGVDGSRVDTSDSAPLPTKVQDNDLVIDHANGVKVTSTASSSTLINTNAKFLQISTTATIFVRTDGAAAADAAGSIRITEGDFIPIRPNINVTVFGAATVYAVPYITR